MEVEGKAHLGGSDAHEVAHRVLPARGDHVVARRFLLQHAPHRVDVVARMPPVAAGV